MHDGVLTLTGSVRKRNALQNRGEQWEAILLLDTTFDFFPFFPYGFLRMTLFWPYRYTQLRHFIKRILNVSQLWLLRSFSLKRSSGKIRRVDRVEDQSTLGTAMKLPISLAVFGAAAFYRGPQGERLMINSIYYLFCGKLQRLRLWRTDEGNLLYCLNCCLNLN